MISENKKQVSENIRKGARVFYKTSKVIKREAQQRRLERVPENTLKKMIKAKKEKLESRMMFKQRHYARMVQKNAGKSDQ